MHLQYELKQTQKMAINGKTWISNVHSWRYRHGKSDVQNNARSLTFGSYSIQTNIPFHHQTTTSFSKFTKYMDKRFFKTIVSWMNATTIQRAKSKLASSPRSKQRGPFYQSSFHACFFPEVFQPIEFQFRASTNPQYEVEHRFLN